MVTVIIVIKIPIIFVSLTAVNILGYQKCALSLDVP